MRYQVTDHKRAAIKSMLPNKPRGVARVNDRVSPAVSASRTGSPLVFDFDKTLIRYPNITDRSIAALRR